ncbi:hypothetical protein FB451DRAFT_1393706 [Mycena latifolia]|nr:hypothetical protein FB451DRAFT_1393706 [Mycena latifolia]
MDGWMDALPNPKLPPPPPPSSLLAAGLAVGVLGLALTLAAGLESALGWESTKEEKKAGTHLPAARPSLPSFPPREAVDMAGDTGTGFLALLAFLGLVPEPAAVPVDDVDAYGDDAALEPVRKRGVPGLVGAVLVLLCVLVLAVLALVLVLATLVLVLALAELDCLARAADDDNDDEEPCRGVDEGCFAGCPGASGGDVAGCARLFVVVGVVAVMPLVVRIRVLVFVLVLVLGVVPVGSLARLGGGALAGLELGIARLDIRAGGRRLERGGGSGTAAIVVLVRY